MKNKSKSGNAEGCRWHQDRSVLCVVEGQAGCLFHGRHDECPRASELNRLVAMTPDEYLADYAEKARQLQIRLDAEVR